MIAYLSEGQFPQEVGTAAPQCSDDLTEKTDWIIIVIEWPCETEAAFKIIITDRKL